jgi:hypothetical protein
MYLEIEYKASSLQSATVLFLAQLLLPHTSHTLERIFLSIAVPIHYTLQNYGNPLIWGNSPHFPFIMMERWQLKLSSSAATKALEM